MFLDATPPTVVDTAANAKAEDARTRKLRSLQTAESLAMLSEPPLTPHSQRHSTHFAQLPHATDETPLSLQLSLHRGRLALLVGLVTVAIITLTVVLRQGAELDRFDRRDVTVSEQEKLLDRYNSYSGTIASALGRPLEIFVAILVQVVVLWLMTDSVLTLTTRWRVKLTVLAVGASVGFLLTNGLSALNVQVIELPVRTVMSLSDLQVQDQSNVSISSTANYSFPERSPKNPTANTVLRGLVLPRVAVSSTCGNQSYRIPTDVVAYGIPQQSWMKQLFPEAITPVSTMKVDLLAQAPQASTPDKFPMNVSVAADLILAAVNTRHAYAFFDGNLTAEIAYNARRLDNVNDSPAENSPWRLHRTVPTTRLVGLLPLDERSTEEQDRTWFLDHFKAFIHNATSADWRNVSLVRWDMEMSRVQLTPSIWVDAVTFESELIPKNIESIRVNGSLYYPAPDYNGLLPPLRIFEFDGHGPDAEVHAFAVCADGEVDGLSTKFDPDSESTRMVGGSCFNKSTTSMYVFSAGRHAVADAYLGDSLTKKQLYGPEETDTSTVPGVARDARMVYTSTFARVSWKLQNLSELYGASCTDMEGGCLGLAANLSGTDQQRLLVGAAALPLGQLYPITYTENAELYEAQPFEIVLLHRPTMVTGKEIDGADITSKENRFWLGDVLLRHNIGNITNDSIPPRCEDALDRRVRNYVDNHLYIESTLQPTYTAAAFFLFQNGMVRELLPQKAASGRVSLQLDRNVREMKVWLSTPEINADLTLTGCATLAVALCVMFVRSYFSTNEANERSNYLAVTTPHQVARVMLDDTTFPALLLKRRLFHDGHEGDAGEFVIDRLSLQPASTNTEKARTIEV